MRHGPQRRISGAVLLFCWWWWCDPFTVVSLSAQVLTFESVGTILGPAELIKVSGRYAYVSADKTLRIVDISDPGAPKTVSEYSFPARIAGFRMADPFIYVAADVFGLGILESSKAGVLTLRGSLKTRGQAKNVAVSGMKALVTDVVSGVDIVDITNPSQPVHIGSVFLEGVATDVTAAGLFAYASDRPSGFYVIDPENSNATAPLSGLQSSNPSTFPFQAQVELLKTSAQASTTAVVIAGGLLQFFDVSNPASPVELPAYRTPGFAWRLSFDGTRAYIADGPTGLQVVDLSTPAKPRILGAYKTATPAVDVAVADSLVFVAVRTGGVIILRQARSG